MSPDPWKTYGFAITGTIAGVMALGALVSGAVASAGMRYPYAPGSWWIAIPCLPAAGLSLAFFAAPHNTGVAIGACVFSVLGIIMALVGTIIDGVYWKLVRNLTTCYNPDTEVRNFCSSYLHLLCLLFRLDLFVLVFLVPSFPSLRNVFSAPRVALYARCASAVYCICSLQFCCLFCCLFSAVYSVWVGLLTFRDLRFVIKVSVKVTRSYAFFKKK
jgi:hypothetical protein